MTAVALYVLAGSAWLYLKTSGDTQALAARSGRIAAVALGVGTAASWALASSAGPLVLHPGAAARLPVWICGGVVLAAGVLLAFGSFGRPARSDWSPSFATAAVYVGGLLLAGGLLYPTLVPPTVTVHAAASPHQSLLFLLIGVGVFIPIILAYQSYGYWVFRAKLNPRNEPVREEVKS